ncbi:ABC transporter ATP-binding protein [Microbacterium sp. RD1]|uniref:ABC transporter ATP-binding protein n=1 Tax=Microbacterium sp. RD1 TaxID=3457313 RepID=UPI003FA55CC4
MSALLNVRDITVAYGQHSPVLHDVDFSVDRGEVVGLVGMNGAGKSTLLKAISGGLKLRAGAVEFDGADVTKTETPELVRRGLIVLAEGHRVIRPLTVRENLEVAAMSLSPAKVRQRLAEVEDLIHALFPVLTERRKQLAGLLSGGEQQMLSVARAIVQNPKLLLLDEPSLGLAPLVIDRIYESLDAFRDRGVSMLIVEQNSDRVAKACSRLVVLREGRIVAQGSPTELSGAALNSAYFG